MEFVTEPATGTGHPVSTDSRRQRNPTRSPRPGRCPAGRRDHPPRAGAGGGPPGDPHSKRWGWGRVIEDSPGPPDLQESGSMFHGAGGLPAVQPKAVEPRTIKIRNRKSGAGGRNPPGPKRPGTSPQSRNRANSNNFFLSDPPEMPDLPLVGGLTHYR